MTPAQANDRRASALGRKHAREGHRTFGTSDGMLPAWVRLARTSANPATRAYARESLRLAWWQTPGR